MQCTSRCEDHTVGTRLLRVGQRNVNEAVESAQNTMRSGVPIFKLHRLSNHLPGPCWSPRCRTCSVRIPLELTKPCQKHSDS